MSFNFGCMREREKKTVAFFFMVRHHDFFDAHKPHTMLSFYSLPPSVIETPHWLPAQLVSQAITHVGIKNLFFKGNPKQRPKLAWKHGHFANISICRLRMVVLSICMQQKPFCVHVRLACDVKDICTTHAGFFMGPPTQTARHKTAALTAMFSRFSNVDLKKKKKTPTPSIDRKTAVNPF